MSKSIDVTKLLAWSLCVAFALTVWVALIVGAMAVMWR